MKAQLIPAEDEHHWVLVEHTLTQIVVERGSVGLLAWSLEGSLELRFSAPFTLTSGSSGATRLLDPAIPESLAPALALVGVGVRSLTVTREGRMTLELGDGVSIEASRGPRPGGWRAIGAGLLEGMLYEG